MEYIIIDIKAKTNNTQIRNKWTKRTIHVVWLSRTPCSFGWAADKSFYSDTNKYYIPNTWIHTTH